MHEQGFDLTVKPLFVLCTMRTFLRFVFSLLYHPFAWSYDLVAATVSLGHWNEWVRSTLPLIQGRKVLELGSGPGHLQVELKRKGFLVFGLDESWPMVRQSSHRLRRKGYPANLVRGLTQHLPFEPSFETVIATFPSEYIFDPDTIREIHRVLIPGGRLIVLLSAGIGIPLRREGAANMSSGRRVQGALIRREKRLQKISGLFTREGFVMEINHLPMGLIALLVLSGEKPATVEHRGTSQS